MLCLHRKAGVAVVALVVVVLIDDPSRPALLDPRSAPARARAGVLALLGLAALAGTSGCGSVRGLNYGLPGRGKCLP